MDTMVPLQIKLIRRDARFVAVLSFLCGHMHMYVHSLVVARCFNRLSDPTSQVECWPQFRRRVSSSFAAEPIDLLCRCAFVEGHVGGKPTESQPLGL